ncbi:hypothetical protein B0H19DRAFT_1227413, partial [Mycena capillaripes]
MLLHTQMFKDYAAKQKLVTEDLRQSPMYGLAATTIHLTHTRPDGHFGQEYLVLCLYSNYNINRRRLVKEDERDVIEIIQRELGISESPKWYWDWMNDFPNAAFNILEIFSCLGGTNSFATQTRRGRDLLVPPAFN